MSHTALRTSFDADWHNLDGAFVSHGGELVHDRMSESNSLSCSLILLRYKPQHNILLTVADDGYYHHRSFFKTVETVTS